MTGFLDDIRGNVLATGVGSLPYADPRRAVDAVFDALSYHIPFWPQLPRRSFLENMYVQFSEGFPGLRVDEAKRFIWVRAEGQEYANALEDCFNRCMAAEVDTFAISPAYAEGLSLFCQRLMGLSWKGWVKAQVIGPYSLGLSLLDESKNPILYDAELGDLLPLFLAMKTAWLIRQLKVHAKTRVIIFIDEPYLVAVGTSQSTLKPQEIIGKINQVVRVIHDNGALAGLHCCGNTDWDLVMATDIDILNFDAYGYLDKLVLYEKALTSFTRQGKLLAIGIVPSNEDIGQVGLGDRLSGILRKHPKFFANGALVTTSCGLSGISEGEADKALKLSVELAERSREAFI